MKFYKISKWVRWTIYFLEIYFLHSLEQSNLIHIPYFDVTPIVSISSFVCIALFENEHVGMIFGIVCGSFLDISFGTPIGVCMLLMGIIGYFLGVVSNYFIKTGFWAAWFLCSIITILIIFFRFCFLYLFTDVCNLSLIWTSLYNPLIVSSIVLSPIVYLLNRSIFYFFLYTGGGEDKIGFSE